MNKKTILFILCGAMAFGCGDDDTTPMTDGGGVDGNTPDTNGTDVGPQPDTGMDAGPDDPDVGPPLDPTCENLCMAAMDSCDGNLAAYASMGECMTWCDTVGAWEAGTAGEATGNTIACRITALQAGNCDAGGFTGGNVCGTYCENYCDNTARTCEGAANELYANDAACMAACEMFDMNGEAGAIDGNTVQCRIYHGGIPADGNPDTHCSHAGEEPTAFCVFDNMGFEFNMAAPDTFVRVDRMGMPAVSTALAFTDEEKAAYNDANPSDDAALTFATVLITNLGAIHGLLDGVLEDTAGVTPCSMDPDTSHPLDLPFCIAQTIGDGGPSVVSIVVPDTLTLDTEGTTTFPNGRALADPVIDVTLAVILLDLTVNTALDLVGTNPAANDIAFRDAFPYLAAPQ